MRLANRKPPDIPASGSYRITSYNVCYTKLLRNRPLLSLVGKGVCFDTGGLDLKNASGMALMKKDMGGAAHVLALARLVMACRLPVRLQVVITSYSIHYTKLYDQ